MEEAEQNKSEQPSQHKLSQARRKGSVARGMDLGVVAALAAFGGYFWLQGPKLAARIGEAARAALTIAPQVTPSPNQMLTVTGKVLSQAGAPLLTMAAIIFLVVLAVEALQTGVVFTTEPLRPDFSRLSPAKGLKRVFTVRMLVETAKSLLKLAVYGSIAVLVVREAAAAAASVADASSLTDAMRRTGSRLLMLFVVAGVGLAVLDQLIVRRDFLKKMRMSRREVRREARDREGEPRLKQRRKQLHGELLKQSQSLRNVRGADVLITNPTHFAVALRYDSRTMAAPTVVSQGAHQVAGRLRGLAFAHGVTVVSNPPLARALFRCAFLREVPEALYPLVADVYRTTKAAREQGSAGHA